MDDRTEREILARLDYIERYLAELGGQAGIRYTSFAVAMNVASQVADLARQGLTDEAVRQFRAVTHANLQQAGDVIAQIQGGRSVFGSGSGPGNLGSEPFHGPEWSDDGPGQPFPAAAGGVGGYNAASGLGGYDAAGGVDGYIAADWVESDIVALARSGRMIEAIKMYRQRTGADLKQATAAVEQAARGY